MRSPGLALAAALALLPSSARAVDPNVELFEKSLQAAAEALRVYGSWDEPAQLARVAEIGYRVAQEAGYRDYPLSFYLIDLAEPNAFALPAGQVFVTRGLIALGLTDDELAALLGHEIAHVVNRHGVRMERRATLLNVLTQAAVLGVMLSADRGSRPDPRLPYPYNVDPQGSESADLITGTYATSLILGELLLRSYSRDYEDEADRDGQRWAAAAGYAVGGTAKLMEVLGSRIPDSKEYGYWRTHPFFDQRVAAARIRAKTVEPGVAKPTAEFRSWSQREILELGSGLAAKPPAARTVESAALTAWPRGAEAERLRLERLHRLREETLARIPVSRDYGKLLAAYDRELDEMAAFEPSVTTFAALREERSTLSLEATGLLPQAQEIWRGGVYETGFLETYLSNWPQAGEAPAIALALGDAYSRTGRQADAVTMYLRAEQAAGTEPAVLAGRGLRALAPRLDHLTALAELAGQVQDPDLATAARGRLGSVAASYSDISVGAAYLERFPDGEHAAAVAGRQNLLAENLYGEILLYQGIGDHLKAIDRMQKILTYAPTSPAAGKLLERVVLPG